MLPLSTNYSLSKELGMRHRASVGLSERSDAVIIIVSEQTGSISIANEGMLKRNLDNETFEKLLWSEVLASYNKRDRKVTRKFKEKSDA
jgi:diadenylate cyclase